MTGTRNGSVPALVLVSTAASYGGGERYALRVARLYAEHCGLNVCVAAVCPGLTEQARAELAPGGAEVVSVSGLWDALALVYRRRRAGLCDVVHLNGQRDIVLAPACRLLGIPSLTVRHTEVFRERTWRSFIKVGLYAMSLPFVRTLVCVSEHARNDLHRVLGKWAGGVVIQNWVDDEELEPPGDDKGRCAGGKKRILIVARLDPVKGHALLFEACRRRDDVVVDVVGGGDRGQSFLADVPACVQFHGHRDDLSGFHRRADVLVCPSLSEGSSLSVIEAMAKGLPCVVSDIPALRELVVDGVNGLMFRCGDADDLTQKLNKVLDSSELRDAVGRAGYQEVLRHRTRTAASREYCRQIQRTLHPASGAARVL